MTFKNYTIGFALSLLLTLGSFALVQMHALSHHQFPSHELLTMAIAALAIIQLAVQMVFFLHLGKESKARDLVMLAFAAAIVALVVGGTLWIMANLQHGMQTPFEGPVAPQNEL